MRYLVYPFAILFAIILFVAMFFRNLPALVHNIFYATKRPVSWDPKGVLNKPVQSDEYDRLYH